MKTASYRRRITVPMLLMLASMAPAATPLVHLPQLEPPGTHPTRILVRFKPNATASAGTDLRRVFPQATVLRTFRSVEGLTVVEVPQGQTADALDAFNAAVDVLYAEPDYQVQTFGLPNDPFLAELWGLHNTGQIVRADPGTPGADIRAAEAWQLWTGDMDFRIAVIDTGINYNHPDLQANMWVNPGEIPDNGIDDDENGYIDDVHGYNFFNESGDPMDVNSHGTHIAGTICGAGNDGMGIVGLNWACNLVAVRFADEGGGGFISDAIQGIQYAIDNNIRVSNNSWGCYNCFSQALYDVIDASQSIGHIFVAASGNGIFGLGVDIDEIPAYPAGFDLPNVISVAATTNDDAKAKFSNFGINSVDIGAPGETIFSTVLSDGYDYFNGTSMAAPHVTGVVGLMLSRQPGLTINEVRTRLFLTARPVESLHGITATGGVVNAVAAIGDCNGNGTFDETDILTEFSTDCNDNGIPDECEVDCNGNDIADECDILFGPSEDCDGNGVPDECQPDCNENGTADACDIASFTSSDCNENGIPDECEFGHNLDCNANGVPDLCDFFTGVSLDCNGNDIPDECDTALGHSEDCSGNGIPDECERDCNENGLADSCDIFNGTSEDIDGDGIPDECSLGFALVPVSSSESSVIEGQEIKVVAGANAITFEIRISGWDPDQDGVPLLRTYQAGIDASGLTSGDSGELRLARVPCTTSDECIAESLCEADGFCDWLAPIAIDEGHPEYVFSGLATVSLGDPNGIRVGSVIFDEGDSIRDPGVWKYAGTLILDVSEDAVGTFIVGFSRDDCFFGDDTIPGFIFEPHSLLPARIVIAPDCNGNGIPDEQDILDQTSPDCNGNGVPDECDVATGDLPDCNGNGIPDECDVESGQSTDCNQNGIPDECIDLEDDCNNNNIPDECDLMAGRSQDCNQNGIPDECIHLENDCDDNGVPDECDIADGTLIDCNETGIPDVCEDDCNGNGRADECDIADGISEDNDHNAVPDECQTTFHVPQDVPTIQQAIAVAGRGDVIVLAPGTYQGPGNTMLDFLGKDIILRGQGAAEETIIDCIGVATGVQFLRGEGPHARLEDLTIANAFNAGFVCRGSAPTIRRCIIENNGPVSAGILLEQNCRATIEDSLIVNNTAAFSGGGIRVIHSHPTIRRCVFRGNTAFDLGGAVYGTISNLVMTDCLLEDNYADDGGGALALVDGAPYVSRSMFRNNVAGPENQTKGEGGAIYILRARTSFSSCLITGNMAHNLGGGVYMKEGEPEFTNLTIVENVARVAGGGLYRWGPGNQTGACCYFDGCVHGMTRSACMGLAGKWYAGQVCHQVTCGTRACCLPDQTCANLNMLDCIDLDGQPMLEGSQCASHGCAPTLRNAIVWDNMAAFGPNLATDAPFLTVADSIVGEFWEGPNIVVDDPGFVGPSSTASGGGHIDVDYRLRADSIAIDAGSASWLAPTDTADLDGRPRVLCGQSDMGAYEFGAGDFNCDRAVDLSDFAEWGVCFTGVAVTSYPDGCQAFDFDTDGYVNLRDFAAFQNTFGAAAP
jgi:predicted outer membrane repeat protein